MITTAAVALHKVTDIATLHYLKKGEPQFLYELDGCGKYEPLTVKVIQMKFRKSHREEVPVSMDDTAPSAPEGAAPAASGPKRRLPHFQLDGVEDGLLAHGLDDAAGAEDAEAPFHAHMGVEGALRRFGPALDGDGDVKAARVPG